jgi:hypothetical protein
MLKLCSCGPLTSFRYQDAPTAVSFRIRPLRLRKRCTCLPSTGHVRYLVEEVSDRLARPLAPEGEVHVPQQQPRPQRLHRRRAAGHPPRVGPQPPDAPHPPASGSHTHHQPKYTVSVRSSTPCLRQQQHTLFPPAAAHPVSARSSIPTSQVLLGKWRRRELGRRMPRAVDPWLMVACGTSLLWDEPEEGRAVGTAGAS